MAHTPSLLEQFRAFQAENPCDDPEKAFEYFCVFGGSGLRIDTSLPLEEAIERTILDDYPRLYAGIRHQTGGDADAHALLTGAALGDRRTHSAFKRSRLSDEAANAALTTMCTAGVVWREKARPNRFSWLEDHVISDRIHFTTPFSRFWFAFVSPIFRGIKTGDYGEFRTRFANHFAGFGDAVFEALSMELIKKEFAEDPITEIGGYWDNSVSIDIVATTASGRGIVGSCRYVNAKLKKSELTRLRELAAASDNRADICVLCAKTGFSKELRALKGDDVRLFSLRHFRTLR